MSKPFKVVLQLDSQGSRQVAIDQARKAIFAKLGIANQPPTGNTGNINPSDVVIRFNERLLTIISQCEQYAVKRRLTLIVSLNGGYTYKSAQRNILNALFIECEEARLATALEDIIDDLKEMKRRADIAAQVSKERKAVDDGLRVILWRLARSDYCDVMPSFDKATFSFKFTFVDRGRTHFFDAPLKEEEFLWDPDLQKGQIRAFLHSILNSGFPWIFTYHQWHVYRHDPEDFDSAMMEFQNLPDDSSSSDWDGDLDKRYREERRQIYRNMLEAGGGAFGFVANFFFDHVVRKALYAIPVVGEVVMIYDMAQLASELPDNVRAFASVILDDDEEEVEE